MSDRFEHADCADDYREMNERPTTQGRTPAWMWRADDHRIHSIGDPVCVQYGCEPIPAPLTDTERAAMLGVNLAAFEREASA